MENHFLLSMLTALLALSTPEAEWLISGLAVMGLLVGIAVGVKKLREKRSDSIALTNTPIEIRSVAEYVPMTRFTKLEEYIHTRNHEIGGHLQHLTVSAEERRTEAAQNQMEILRHIAEIGEKLDTKRSVSVGNLHEQLKGAEIRLSGIEGEVRALVRIVDSDSGKIDRILERLPRRA